MKKKTATSIEAAVNQQTPSITPLQLVSGMLPKRQALGLPLPWRDQIEALPDNARLNIGSTNPLVAAENHQKRQRCPSYKQAVYHPPASTVGFSVYISGRESQILQRLQQGDWVLSACLKGAAETRRPLATLREFGLIVVTCHHDGGDCYRLLGSIDLKPTPPVLSSAAKVIDLLPDRETAANIERNRARSEFAKRLALIEKRAFHLRPPTDPEQLELPDSAA